MITNCLELNIQMTTVPHLQYFPLEMQPKKYMYIVVTWLKLQTLNLTLIAEKGEEIVLQR